MSDSATIEKMQQEIARLNAHIEDLDRRLQHSQPELRYHSYPPEFILSRTDFNREVTRMLAVDARYASQSTLIYFNFPNLSDVFHGINLDLQNIILEKIAALLCRQTRKCDVVGQLAMSEYGLFLTRCEQSSAELKAQSIAILLKDMLAESVGERALLLNIEYGAYTFAVDEDVETGLQQVVAEKSTFSQN